MRNQSHETEIKLPVPGVQSARRLLRAAGFRVSRRRVFEANTVFDTPTFALRNSRSLLRVRRAGGLATLTYKGPPVDSRHKSREELELEICNADTMGEILARLGFEAQSCYEKYRTEFRRPHARGLVTLDETPVGIYLELEGAPAWIDRTARQLGFEEKDYITASYARLYQEWCGRRGIAPANMVFPP
jgi:adenylate cyclase class 2